MSTQDLGDRTKYIGGSDVGAILGYNRYRSPLEVYREKAEGELNEFENTYTYWGNIIEDVVRSTFVELTGLKVETASIKYHDKHKFLAAHVDGLIPEKNAILEIKTVSPYVRNQWGHENHDLGKLYENENFDVNGGLSEEIGTIPNSYLFQCIHYAAIYEAQKVYIAVYFGNDLPLKIYQYDRNMELEKTVLEKLCNFWNNNILKEIPPELQTMKDVTTTYSISDPEKTMVSTNEITCLYEELKELRKKEKELDLQVDNIKKNIMMYMGEGELLLDISGDKLCSWKNTKTKRFDVSRFKNEQPDLSIKYYKETSSRRFLVH